MCQWLLTCGGAFLWFGGFGRMAVIAILLNCMAINMYVIILMCHSYCNLRYKIVLLKRLLIIC